MDQQWLLRIGLTLTLLASLLITPDLVGIARWTSLQRTFSNWADSLKEALARLGHEPKAESGLFQYLAKVLSDVVGGIAILIVTVTAGLLLFTAVPAFLVASWLGAAVLAIWGSLVVVAAWAIQVRRVLRERSQRNAGATLARLLVSPVTGSARFAAD
jgi:hypothetical protein